MQLAPRRLGNEARPEAKGSQSELRAVSQKALPEATTARQGLSAGGHERAFRTASSCVVCAPTRPVTLETTRHENISNPRGFPACPTYRR